MQRKPARELGPIVGGVLCLALIGGCALWGVSGAIVVSTLCVAVAILVSSAERHDVGSMTPRPRRRAFFDRDRADEDVLEYGLSLATSETAGPVAGWSSVSLRRVLSQWSRLARVESPRQLATIASTAVVGVTALVSYLREIGANPAGLFCDEAEIGLEGFRLLRGDAELTSIPFFYHHFDYDLGFLAPLSTAPFVALFGLDDAGVRIASAVLSLAMLSVVFVTLRRLQIPYAAVAVAVYAFSPIVIHLSRVNFGHAPSMLLIALGFDRFVVARRSGRRTPAAVAGVLIGASAYGNASFYVVAPLVIGAIGFSEVVYNHGRLREYVAFGLMATFAAAWGAPLVFRALTDDDFWRRFKEKNAYNAPWTSVERLKQLIDNYPKYFSKAFLFDVGEVGLPGGFISRHSVAGAGVLADVALPVVLFGIVSFWLLREDPNARFVLPGVVIAVLYPLPDLISTSSDRPPYTLSLFGTTLCLPYLAGWALRGSQAIGAGSIRLHVGRFGRLFSGVTRSREHIAANAADETRVHPWLAPVIATGILLWALVSGWQFFRGPYQHYPDVSADYWGWQFGPRAMIEYFVEHEDEYDEFIMDGNFNEAYIFLDFYIRDPEIRRRASIGDLSRLDVDKRQLFGIRAETWNRTPGSQFPSKSYLRIDEVVFYPNGKDAMYLVELR